MRERLSERVFVLSTGGASKTKPGSCGECYAGASSLQDRGADESAGMHMSKKEKL